MSSIRKHYIVTQREYMTWPSWHVVYEWEDVMAETMGLGFEYVHQNLQKKLRSFTYKHLNMHTKFSAGKDDWKLIWVMSSKELGMYTRLGCIPIFLDTPADTVESVKAATRELPIFFVTCLDFYYMLEKAGVKNGYYIPLSISDKYMTDIDMKKTCDVLQFGRKNNQLHAWMLLYCQEHSNVEYIYQTENGSLTYTSTTRGEIGRFDQRQEYMELMRSAKVSLVSTPGCDNNRNFGGIDFVTPRFYESVASRCHVIGRYTENEETDRLQLQRICQNVKSYEEFATVLEDSLNRKVDDDIYNIFLKSNCTSRRACEMSRVIESSFSCLL